jgi:tRNA threonylcarbamoyladenosine biosynthesis protein TsaB
VLILGIETSTPQSSVCLATERGLVASATLRAPRPPGAGGRAHGEFLAPAIAFCFEQSGLRMDAVAGVAVSLGPGLFTGMRVGIATAQTIAHARRLPVVGLVSLDLLAYPVRHTRRLIAAVLDARRGELFWAFYRAVPGGVQRTSELQVGPADKLAGEIESQSDDVLCVGDGAIAHAGLLESAGAECSTPLQAHPAAFSLVELAMLRFIREDTQRPEDLRPIYIRKPDAKINWQHRGALFGGKESA